MAEIVKAKDKEELDFYKKNEKQVKSSKKNENSKKLHKKEEENKKSFWERFMIFCHGVKSEAQKVRWTSGKDMIKYSVATIFFILFCCLFFYSVDAIFALIQSLFR